MRTREYASLLASALSWHYEVAKLEPLAMSYNLFGFSPDAFEQFIRALALDVLGPGVTVFGNGPDGGREATFKGKIPFPHPHSECWEGYGVIQAKCKEKSESTQRDQRWALAQLKNELHTFATSTKRQPKPEYYIFATNIALSSSAGGGRDQANALVQSFSRALPLKGFQVWDESQITAFLDSRTGLRRRFLAYTTPGDVLGTLAEALEKRRPNAVQILTTFLERELLTDYEARLVEAGDRRGEPMQLANVFIDLPASAEPFSFPPNEGLDESGRLPSGAIVELLNVSACKLDALSLDQCGNLRSGPADSGTKLFNRFVFFGGPGSGKSTLGQFLAQINRAALLERRPRHLLGDQTRQIISLTRQCCERDGLTWPATPRYPFRVDLNVFAKALASRDENRCTSLADYLLKRLKSAYVLEYEDLLEWLAAHPWLLVLDGLDEVPTSSNRRQLVKAVEDFLIDTRHREADLLVVTTTRPQGYAGELKSGDATFRYLLPLSRPRALEYARRYAVARFGEHSQDRVSELLNGLQDSAERELTSRLISSPLQVTFMVTVIAARGKPGDNRWQLFSSYYRTIYERELQKAVPPYSEILANNEPTINRLHHDVGFLLQLRGETAGGTDAAISYNDFKRLAGSYLQEDGWTGADQDRLLESMMDAAQSRLVFLTSRTPESLSFEVRSLQEYMAAECLMSGDREEVMLRLGQIAVPEYWRNVLLFAIGKCFADVHSRHLQDGVVLLCEELNSETSESVSAIQLGSLTALDVLESGAVAQHPRIARHLAKTASRLVAQSPMSTEDENELSTSVKLANIYNNEFADSFREEIELRLGQKDLNKTVGAWVVLLAFIERQVAWAESLFEKHWPDAPDEQIVILREALPIIGVTSRILDKLCSLVPQVSLKDISSLLEFLDHEALSRFSPPDWLIALLDVLTSENRFNSNIFSECHLNLSSLPQESMSFSLVRCFDPPKAISRFFDAVRVMPVFRPDWLVFVYAANFVREPNCKTLAEVLRKIAAMDVEPVDLELSHLFPWPLAACLNLSLPKELSGLAARIEAGELGDEADWCVAEERWVHRGVCAADLRPTSVPFDARIGSRGFPAYRCGFSFVHRKYADATCRVLLKLIREGSPKSYELMSFALNARRASFSRYISLTGLRDLLGKIKASFPLSTFAASVDCAPNKELEWLNFFDWLGNSDFWTGYADLGDWADDTVAKFADAFANDPTRLGTLRLLGLLATRIDSDISVPPELLRLDLYSDPRYRFAAILIRLTQLNLSEAEAEVLAKAAARISDVGLGIKMRNLDCVCSVLEKRLAQTPAVEKFLFSYMKYLPASALGKIARCERLLSRTVRSVRSGLSSERLREHSLPVPGDVFAE